MARGGFELRLARAVGHGLEQHVTLPAASAPADPDRLDVVAQVSPGISCESCHLGTLANVPGLIPANATRDSVMDGFYAGTYVRKGDWKLVWKAALPPAVELYNASQPDSELEPAIKWDGEWQVTIEVFRDLGLAFAIVLLLIYVLVVGWFQSFTIPLVIMAPIPLTLIGILPGHAISGAFFTATSMIGMIALAGIIVRNSILLVDFIQLEEARGRSLTDAVLEAGAVRFRPIALTAAAVVVGGLVMVLWGWLGFAAFLKMLEIWVDRGDGHGFVPLAFDTTPNYTDTAPLPATPTKWKYRAIYRVGDDQVVQWSEEMTVVVGG